MSLLPDFSHRHRRGELPERMEWDGTFGERLANWRMNSPDKGSWQRWWGIDALLWPAIRRLAKELGRTSCDYPLRLLEVCCGAGDLLLRLAERAKRSRLAIELHGCDSRAALLNIARRRAAETSQAIEYHETDCLAAPLPACFDVVVCSLVLHRLNDAQALILLRHMAGAAGRLVLVADLRRGLEGYLAAQFAARFSFSPRPLWGEGPQSIEASFSPRELEELSLRAGMPGARIQNHWGGRMLLHWDRLQTCEAEPKLALGWSASG